MVEGCHHKIIIIGGGTAGISVASRLARRGLAKSVAIVEPSSEHFYQPLWTLVAAGVFPMKKSRRLTKEYIPAGVTWYQDAVVELSAEQRTVSLKSGIKLTAEWFIVCPGIESDWDAIKGGREALAASNVGCIYEKSLVEETFARLSSVSGGQLIFTFPPPPVKCAGAPQKIMYLADDLLRRGGIRQRATIEYRSALPTIFGVPIFADALIKVLRRKDIKAYFNQKLIEVRPQENKAIFADVVTGAVVAEVTYSFLHVVPPMRPPEFIRKSDLSLASGSGQGWVDVNPFTLRHQRWPHVFALGDVCNAPNAKTGAAIRQQAPVVVDQLLAAMQNSKSSKTYNGYASCPLVTGFGKVILAEFGYDGKLMPTFPGNPARESRLMWWLKTLILPRLYWYLMLRGRA